MKLLYITNGINGAGGLERVLSIKASALAETYGYEITILTLNDAHLTPFYEFSSKIKMVSIPVHGHPIRYFKEYRKGLKKIVKALNPDVISVCDDGLKGFFVPFLIETKAKTIYERHASIKFNVDRSLKAIIIKWIMQSQVSRFDRFVVLTDSNKREWQGETIISIPNPLSFYPNVVSTLEAKKVIAVGSHSYNKGYDTLLEMWKEVEINFPDWVLSIYGKLDKDKTFVNLVRELGLQNVEFHKPVREIEKEFLNSSIMVLPSRSEGFGMVLIEAMACGVPCVAFDCPSGPADIIKNKNDGFLVENQNKEDFKKHLELLMDDHALRMEMGHNGKENVKRFLPEVIVKKWDELFKSLTL